MSEQMEQFLKQGFAIFPAEDMNALHQLRNEIFQRAKVIFESDSEDPEHFFNHFHELDVTGTKLNELRVKLVKQCTDEVDSGTLIFKAFRKTLLALLGPDLLVQKNTNLVIQQPNDPNPSELHRDAPANSPYEVVVWLPLVDCYDSKGMYLVERERTEKGLGVLDDPSRTFPEFEDFALKNSVEIPAPFGTALLFWPGVLHGSRINQEKETRWSLNMRYKNIFSPNGLKEPFEFFKVFQLSPLTKIAMDFERKERIG